MGSRARVIWVIFDELSEEIVFRGRPAGLQLPNFDRLRAESLHASAAESPSAATLTSLPSLILGRRVTATEPRGPNRVLLTLEGEAKPVEWGEAPNVFDAAYRTGHNTALVGWYHPYGRLLSRSLTKCYWTAWWLPSGVEEPTWPRPFRSLSVGPRPPAGCRDAAGRAFRFHAPRSVSAEGQNRALLLLTRASTGDCGRSDHRSGADAFA